MNFVKVGAFIFLLGCWTLLASAQSPLCAGSASGGTISGTPICSVSVDDLCSGRAVAGSSGPTNQLPPWINLTLAAQGQSYIQCNGFAAGFSAFYGLLSILTMPDISDVLLFTNNSDDPLKVAKRYLATGTQVYLWTKAPISTDPVDNAWLTSISHVRELHVSAAQRAAVKSPAPGPYADPTTYANVQVDSVMWNAFNADLVASTIPTAQRSFSANYLSFDSTSQPINQFTQAVTLFGFLGYLVIDPASVYYYTSTDEGLRAYIHLWAIIGWTIGIEDEFNPCLQPDVASVRAYFQAIQAKYYTPALFNINQKAKVLIEALIKGIGMGIEGLPPGFSLRPILLRLLRDIIKIPVPHMTAILSPTDALGQLGYDNVFVPSTHLPGAGAGAYVAIGPLIDGLILPLFGPYVTDMQKAENVYYNGTEPLLFIG